MVLIISEERDISTKRVCNWLLYNKVPYIVVYEIDILLNLSLYISNNEINFTAEFQHFKKFKLSEITAFWYRRGRIERSPSKLLHEAHRIEKEIHLYNEWQRLQLLLHILIEKKGGIGNFEGTAFFNKLFQLTIATEVGFKIPTTIISNNSLDLSNFTTGNTVCVTKSFERELRVSDDKLEAWTNGTNIISMKNIEALGDNPLYPSLIQEGIIKKYELRIFYLDGKIWPMCIFHNSTDDIIDYRGSKVPLRMTPYKLPSEIENKIIQLMTILKWNTGSLDILVSERGEYFFLEVNPVGQYDFVSGICNYSLDNEICNYIKKIHLSHA